MEVPQESLQLVIIGVLATQRILKNDLEHQSMRKAARQEAEKWGWAGATKQLRSYYQQVLDKQSIKIAA